MLLLEAGDTQSEILVASSVFEPKTRSASQELNHFNTVAPLNWKGYIILTSLYFQRGQLNTHKHVSVTFGQPCFMISRIMTCEDILAAWIRLMDSEPVFLCLWSERSVRGHLVIGSSVCQLVRLFVCPLFRPAHIKSVIIKVWVVIQLPNLDCKFI